MAHLSNNSNYKIVHTYRQSHNRATAASVTVHGRPLVRVHTVWGLLHRLLVDWLGCLVHRLLVHGLLLVDGLLVAWALVAHVGVVLVAVGLVDADEVVLLVLAHLLHELLAIALGPVVLVEVGVHFAIAHLFLPGSSLLLLLASLLVLSAALLLSLELFLPLLLHS